MLEFKEIKIEDIEVISPYLHAYPSRQCDRAPGTVAMWRNVYGYKYAIKDGTIVFSFEIDNETAYTHPIGRNPGLIFKELEKLNVSKGELRLCSVNNSELPEVLKLYPQAECCKNRDWFDYLYEKEALTNLTGRKYNTPRNHINKFKKLYSDWCFEEITTDNVEEVIKFTDSFTYGSDKGEDAYTEKNLCVEVLNNYAKFAFIGGVLRVNGKIIGWSAGEKIGDTLICHIEKADITYHGAYQMLTNQFLRYFAANDPEIKFINREDDSGDLGLRKAKLAYNPCELIEKNCLKIKF